MHASETSSGGGVIQNGRSREELKHVLYLVVERYSTPTWSPCEQAGEGIVLTGKLV